MGSETPELFAIVTQLLNDGAEIRYGHVFSCDIFSTSASNICGRKIEKTKVSFLTPFLRYLRNVVCYRVSRASDLKFNQAR